MAAASCPDNLGGSRALTIPSRGFESFNKLKFQSRRVRRRDRLWRHVAGAVNPLNDPIENQNFVSGEAHLCFAEDGTWFQGNLVCAQDCIYKITGRRSGRVRTISVSPTVTSSAGSAMSIKAVERRLNNALAVNEKRCFSYSDASLLSTSSSNSFEDDFDLPEEDLDFEDDLVSTEDVIEKFNTCAYYNINILDFETGLHYNFDRVLVRRGESDCWMSDGDAKQLRFEASQSFFGTSADLFVNAQLGPSFVERGLRVYKGELRFVYKDPICFPVTVEASQWCL